MSDAEKMFQDGNAYERVMGRWSRIVGGQFVDWLDVPTGQRWLDVGCGNGAFTEVLIARTAPSEVMGIDPSEGQIAYAKTRPGARTAQFRVGDAQALPYPDASFDGVAMALVIAFVPDPAKAVAEMARVARAGATVATYMWDFEARGVPVWPVYAALQAMGLQPPLPPSALLATPANLRAWWQGAGLDAVETRTIHIMVRFNDFEDYWATSMLPSGPQGVMISKMAPAEREAVRAKLRGILPTAADGTIAYEAVANAVKGRKKK